MPLLIKDPAIDGNEELKMLTQSQYHTLFLKIRIFWDNIFVKVEKKSVIYKKKITSMSEPQKKNHDYHLVDPSPWPAIGAFAFITAIGAVYISIKVLLVTHFWTHSRLYTMYGWWRKYKKANKGDHTPVVQLHLRYGMIMFIASEVMFFVAWFWSYFLCLTLRRETQQYLPLNLRRALAP
ncbi:MAG: hypothetical protein CM15mP111_3590 [Hyphomicrobiales bacterium]|nr:MAG: hypothetical protein CM15mP111_3590 [Hyphomicrobiales bacterium]